VGFVANKAALGATYSTDCSTLIICHPGLVHIRLVRLSNLVLDAD
jgi:hypothetical protein